MADPGTGPRALAGPSRMPQRSLNRPAAELVAEPTGPPASILQHGRGDPHQPLALPR